MLESKGGCLAHILLSGCANDTAYYAVFSYCVPHTAKSHLYSRELAVGREDIERLEREREKAQKEKEEMMSKLEAQERIVSEAQQERDELKRRIQEMEHNVSYSVW